MALEIEDGTQVPGATSYASVEQIRAYAEARGVVLPEEDADVEVLAIQAMDAIESLRGEFKGTKVTKTQSLQWPRRGADVDGFGIEEDEIPSILWQGQAQLAIYAMDGPLMPTGDGKAVKREKVEGAVEVEYHDSEDSNPQPGLTLAKALLNPLLKTEGEGIRLDIIRV